MLGDPDGRTMLDKLFAANAGRRKLIGRLIATGAIPDSPGIEELLTRPE